MTLSEVKKLVAGGKRGLTKRLLAAGFVKPNIRKGAFRKPYFHPQWVVKPLSGNWHYRLTPSPRRNAVTSSCPPIAPFWVVSGYIIQRRYKLLEPKDKERSRYPKCFWASIDFHHGNIGVTSKGEWLLFDW